MKLKLKLQELQSNLQNETIIRILQERKFNLTDFKNSLSLYLENITNITNIDLIKAIEEKVIELISYTNNRSFSNDAHKFTNAANFLIANTPSEVNLDENNLPREIEISEEEFVKRYTRLLELLKLEDQESNLVLETASQGKAFRVNKTKNNSLAFYAESSEKPMIISYERFIENAFKRKNLTYPSYEIVLISKIFDNSIFDFLIKDNTPKDLIEVMKDKLFKNEDELLIVKSKLEEIQNDNLKIEEQKLQFDEIIAKSENLDDRIKAAEDKAKLGSSIKYWDDKRENHRKKFLGFSGLAIFLIGILIAILFYVTTNHNSQTKENINVTTADLQVTNDNNKTVINDKKAIQPILKESISKDSNEKNLFFDYSRLAWYALMIFASSSAFWIIRITVKIALSNLHLSEDAHERVVMIQTYLAFVQEGKIAESDKQYILTSLFKPSNIGIIKDESSVTVTDIISAVKK